MWPFKRFPNVADVVTDGQWVVATGGFEGKPMIVRVNRALTKLMGHPDYGYRVGIAIPLIAPRADGFPNTEEAAVLAEIEDQIDDALTPQFESLFALVITTGGMREFVFYTRDAGAAGHNVAALRSRIQSHELQSYVELDRRWLVFREFLGSIK